LRYAGKARCAAGAEIAVGRKGKTLCKWTQEDIAKRLDEVSEIVGNPKFLCRKCGRAVAQKESVCKPANFLRKE
jgi:hypothetical protein